MEIVNAKIKDTMFGIEDHGIMTFMLYFEWDGYSQGWGGYTMDGKGVGVLAIRKILELVGVSKWEDLKGKLLRLKIVHGEKPVLGNIMEDKWFDIDQFYNEQKP